MSNTHERIGFDRGVHLRGTPLWVDAERKRELCVLTRVLDRLPPVHARAVASESLARLLEALGYRGTVLPAPIGRRVGVGGQQLMCLDNGGRLSDAGALLTIGRERVVLTGALTGRALEWPPADHVVASLVAPTHRGGQWDAVRRSVLRFVTQAREEGRVATVLVDCLDVGILAVGALRDDGVAARPLGLLGRLAPTAKGRADARVALAGARVAPAARIAFIDTGVGRAPPRVDATFRLRWFADAAALSQVVLETGARGVSVALPSGRRLPRLAVGSHVDVRSLRAPSQLTLA